MNATQSISISDLRQNATAAVNAVIGTQIPTIIMQRSKPRAVLVDVDYYQALEEAVLDLTDANEAERAKSEPRIPLLPYVKKRFGTIDL